jgi:hypothetical protein
VVQGLRELSKPGQDRAEQVARLGIARLGVDGLKKPELGGIQLAAPDEFSGVLNAWRTDWDLRGRRVSVIRRDEGARVRLEGGSPLFPGAAATFGSRMRKWEVDFE